ncbi:MAG: protein kinase [Proteobacteria bacterium]|nr:MAG: protein kinase [Pseudomonadota bacterium]
MIVPGGGTFADGVRAAQTQHNLSEAAAHHMALLAMQQCAVMLADFASGFVLADAPAQFEAAWSSGLTPIWLPASMVLSANEVACSWEVTSDSLAAWLADRIGAARLLLVKACALPVVRDAPALATAGVVDASFPAYVKGRRFSWEVLSEDAALAAL